MSEEMVPEVVNLRRCLREILARFRPLRLMDTVFWFAVDDEMVACIDDNLRADTLVVVHLTREEAREATADGATLLSQGKVLFMLAFSARREAEKTRIKKMHGDAVDVEHTARTTVYSESSLALNRN